MPQRLPIATAPATSHFLLRGALIVGIVSALVILVQLDYLPTSKTASQPRMVLSPEQVKSQATFISYDQLARSPARYEGELITFEGKVIQSLQSGLDYTLRVNVSRDRNDFWSNTVYVDYRARSNSAPRIIEGDVIKLWGKFAGIKSYKAVLGNTIQVPYLDAQVIER